MTKNKSYEDNPKSIKYYVKRFILQNKDTFKGRTVVDFPAGNGITSRLVKEAGGIPKPFDLFPEYFQIEGLDCERANIMDRIPMDDGTADMVICQEGIEHFSDQYKAFREFNRITKLNGILLITTPNYSNLQSRMSYFLTESERFNSIMPPNELDSIWMSDKNISNEIYFGHIFLIGIQKLRILARLAGFRIKKIHYTRKRTTSIIILLFTYPFIYLSSWITYRKNIKKNKVHNPEVKAAVYKEIFKLNTDPRLLIDSHLFVEFEKVSELENVADSFRSKHESFSTNT